MRDREIVPKWAVTVLEDGKVAFENREAWNRFTFPYVGKEMTLILKRVSKDRSRQEEKYFHAVVVAMVADAMGIDRSEAKEFLKALFLTTEEKSPQGFRYRRVLSTTELSDRAYREFWESCVRWAALPTGADGLGPSSGLSLYIPLPNEVNYEDAY